MTSGTCVSAAWSSKHRSSDLGRQDRRHVRVGLDDGAEARRAHRPRGGHRAARSRRRRPGQPGIDERVEQPRRGVQALAGGEVLEHPLGPHDETLDEASEALQHVMQQGRRAGQRHALHRGVADVTLVPERLVLHAREGIAAQQPRQAASAARKGWGCACGASPTSPPGRRGRAPGPRAISVCWRLRISVAKRSMEPPVTAMAARNAAWRSRWTIWVLAGSTSRSSAWRTSASTSGGSSE